MNIRKKLAALGILGVTYAASARAEDTTLTTITSTVNGIQPLVTTLIGIGVSILVWRLVRKYLGKA